MRALAVFIGCTSSVCWTCPVWPADSAGCERGIEPSKSLSELFQTVIQADRRSNHTYILAGHTKRFREESFHELKDLIQKKFSVRLKLLEQKQSGANVTVQFEIHGRRDRLLELLFSWVENERHLRWLSGG